MKHFLLILISILFSLPIFAAEDMQVLPSQIGIVKNVEFQDVSDGVAQAKQLATIKITTGVSKGNIVELENMLSGNPYYDINLKKGQKIILHTEDNGNGLEYSVEDIKRSGNLVWLSLIFCGLLLYVGKKKGLYSLVSIGLTVILISHMLAPMILFGINPVFASIIICILSTAITMYLVGGLNAKSTSATLGAIMSLAFAGILAFIIMNTANLTGFSGENSMFLYAAHPELDFIGIAISAIILATLGAVMDVAMSIASTINEIHITDKTKGVKELFVSGMNVGRDIIGTMANTLILVYLGGSLPLLLLAGNLDLQKFINLNQVVTEIASALIGSIAIVICVPFTALVASGLIYKYTREAEYNDIKLD